MDKSVKFAIIIGALLAGFGVFYHFVIFLPGVERANAAAREREKVAKEREKADAQRKDEARKAAYSACMESAQANYNLNWAIACETTARQKTVGRENCLAQGLGAAFCRSVWGNPDPSPDCTLPGERAKALNEVYSEDQAKCATEVRLGLQ